MQQPQRSDVWSERVDNWLVARTSFAIKGLGIARDDGLYGLVGGGVAVGIRSQRVLMVAVKTPDAQARINNICRSFEIDASFLEIMKLIYPAESLRGGQAGPIDPIYRPLVDLIDWSVASAESPVSLATACGDGDVRSNDTKEVA